MKPRVFPTFFYAYPRALGHTVSHLLWQTTRGLPRDHLQDTLAGGVGSQSPKQRPIRRPNGDSQGNQKKYMGYYHQTWSSLMGYEWLYIGLNDSSHGIQWNMNGI